MAQARRTIIVMVLDESTGLDARALGPRQSRRLHRNSRGNISILFVLLAFIFYGMASMVWNTGYTISAKMHTQTAADASAYSAAVWTSRTTNMITGTNMMILRNHSAMTSVFGCTVVLAGVPINWAKEISDAAGCAPAPFNAVCIAIAVARVLVEVPPYVSFFANCFGEVIRGFGIPGIFGRYPNRINEIHDFQTELIEALPAVIAEQERALEEYYGVDLRYTVPGRSDGRVTPPLQEGNIIQTGAMVAGRWYLKDNNWPDEGNFDGFDSIGKSNNLWNGATIGAIVLGSLLDGSDNYVLPSQFLFLEISPDSLEDRKPFTVVATAVENDVTQGRLAMNGLFNEAIHANNRIVAYAQAETYNGISERVNELGFPVPVPFRVWSTWGWQWQARLTRGDQLENAFTDDPDMRALYAPVGITTADESNFSDVAHH